MEYCILMGSPRKNGNTMSLLEPFMRELRVLDAGHTLIRLHDKRIEPCIACRACQYEWAAFGCRHRDDMQEIFDTVLVCDVIVLATPIYSWYCTPPMKAAIDRLVYGMNKYYGDERGPSLWKGKRLALLATCGYSPEKATDLWEAGIKRYCKHSQLLYAGMLAERDLGYRSVFMDAEKDRRARLFARRLQGADDSARE